MDSWVCDCSSCKRGFHQRGLMSLFDLRTDVLAAVGFHSGVSCFLAKLFRFTFFARAKAEVRRMSEILGDVEFLVCKALA